MTKINTVYRCSIISTVVGKKPTKTRVKEKTFTQGQEIDLMAVNGSSMPNGYALMFVTKDGYLIPSIAVNPLFEKQMTDPNISDAIVLEENGEKKLSKSDKLNGVMFKSYEKKSKIAVYGALIGGGLMLMRAYKTGGSKFIYATVGVIGGGFLGNQVTKLKIKKK